MGKKLLLIMAELDGLFVGGALNMIGGDTLYGRYWGCLENFKFLHFEVCYYQAIDFAIKHGLRKVEAGAQGHKFPVSHAAIVAAARPQRPPAFLSRTAPPRAWCSRAVAMPFQA